MTPARSPPWTTCSPRRAGWPTTTATVAVTMGEQGAALAEPGRPPSSCPPTRSSGDTCGAGDRFAARLTCGAVRAPTGRRRWPRPCERRPVSWRRDRSPRHRLAWPVRWNWPSVCAARVAGSSSLEGASTSSRGPRGPPRGGRGLGDCLIVCMNSDRSVSQLKGPGRPLVGEEDRRRVLEALGCVGAVHVFDEVTPCEALRVLRPHLFAKAATTTRATFRSGTCSRRGVVRSCCCRSSAGTPHRG